jgi:hypothetical protein
LEYPQECLILGKRFEIAGGSLRVWRWDLRSNFTKAVGHLAYRGVEQAVFVTEVVVDELLVRPGPCGDPIDAGTREAVVRELVNRGLENLGSEIFGRHVFSVSTKRLSFLLTTSTVWLKMSFNQTVESMTLARKESRST